MDYKQKITELRAKKAELKDKADALIAEDKVTEAAAIADEMEGLVNSIATLERLAASSADNAISTEIENEGEGAEGEVKDKKPLRLFNSLGEQLQAIYGVTKGIQDSRLTAINNAVAGSSEGIGADGGFAVQEDFAGAILETAVNMGDIISRVDSYTVGANSNSVRFLAVDETDVSASVFGGVQMYWSSEAATVLSSKPKFREVKLDLEKMMGFAYATDELLQDATFMSGFFSRAFAMAADRLLEDGIICGDGAGKPLGILNSKALIEVPKVTGQDADTLVGQNFLDMWSSALVRQRKNAVWVMHPDCETQLPGLHISGTNSDQFFYSPPGLLNPNYGAILGRPVVYSDSMSALGDKGDVMLADLQQYMLLRKGTMKQDWSIHVQFLTDQNCFRVVFRCNGAPKVGAPVKIKNSSKRRSPFVTLAARA